MRITDFNNYNSTNFKSFRVSFDTEEFLRKFPNNLLADILDSARRVERTEFYDLELLSDMRFRIREKGNYFSGIAEPIAAVKPKAHDNRIKITGLYDGIEDETRKCGDPCEAYIEYNSHAEALKGYKMIDKGENKIDRISIITKEMDNQKLLNQTATEDKRKPPLFRVVMDKYGDIVKEFKPKSEI